MRLPGLALLVAAVTSIAQAADGASAPPAQIENSLGMRFVLVPAGEFLMGSDESPQALAAAFPDLERRRFDALADEAPVHRVRITRPFYLGRHEVTVGQFRRFLELSGYVPESVADGTGGYGYDAAYDPAKTVRGDAFDGRDPKYSWRNPGFEQGDDHPVVNVTWHDAVAMARWLGETEGATYRLPTEAEWEYACRSGTRSRYHDGDDPRTLLRVANLFDADARRLWPKWAAHALDGNDGFAFTAPVGSFAPNAFGLYDMHGNAWEWTADWHDDGYYARSAAADPAGPGIGHGARAPRRLVAHLAVLCPLRLPELELAADPLHAGRHAPAARSRSADPVRDRRIFPYDGGNGNGSAGRGRERPRNRPLTRCISHPRRTTVTTN